MHAVMERVGKSKVKHHDLASTLVGNQKVNQEVGRRLADILLLNDHIKILKLTHTDLLVSENAEEWVDTLMKSKNLITLNLYGVGDKIVGKLKEQTWDHEPILDIELQY